MQFIYQEVPNMKKFTLTLCLLIECVLSVACSNDETTDSSIVGTWQLTTWTINIPMDLNNDSITSTNLLDEATCDNNETLVFESNGTVSSNSTYNPQVNISLLESTDDYLWDVVCDTEGTIGLAGSYTQNNNSITLFNTTAVVSDNQLTIVYENAIDIYNEDFTQVVTKKDLTLVYTKK